MFSEANPGSNDASGDKFSEVIPEVYFRDATFSVALSVRESCRACCHASRGQQLTWTIEALEERPQVGNLEDPRQGNEALQQWRLPQVAKVDRIETGVAAVMMYDYSEAGGKLLLSSRGYWSPRDVTQRRTHPGA